MLLSGNDGVVEVPTNTPREKNTLFFPTIQASFSSLRLSEHVWLKDVIHVQGQAH